MGCETCREALSARLDGEEPDVPAAELEAHVASCAACRAWLAAAQRLHRQVRVAPAEPVPDLTAGILAAAAPPFRSHRVSVIRAGLVVVAVTQLALSVPELAGGLHLDHEMASWMVAAAVGFINVAWRPHHVAGALSVIAAAVITMVAVSVRDVAMGHVHLRHEAMHLLLVAGLLLLVVLWRTRPAGQPGPVVVVGASERTSRGRSRRAA
jgi:predicted anti-sigma-YlaC factor YlaD